MGPEKKPTEYTVPPPLPAYQPSEGAIDQARKKAIKEGKNPNEAAEELIRKFNEQIIDDLERLLHSG